jgi:hypothetical protein
MMNDQVRLLQRTDHGQPCAAAQPEPDEPDRQHQHDQVSAERDQPPGHGGGPRLEHRTRPGPGGEGWRHEEPWRHGAEHSAERLGDGNATGTDPAGKADQRQRIDRIERQPADQLRPEVGHGDRPQQPSQADYRDLVGQCEKRSRHQIGNQPETKGAGRGAERQAPGDREQANTTNRSKQVHGGASRGGPGFSAPPPGANCKGS